MHWCQECEEQDKTSGKSDLSRTSDILQASMKDVYRFLNFTMEVAEDFEDHKLPNLDFKLWVIENNVVVYTFFEKPRYSTESQPYQRT